MNCGDIIFTNNFVLAKLKRYGTPIPFEQDDADDNVIFEITYLPDMLDHIIINLDEIGVCLKGRC